MTRPGIEPGFSGPLANTLPTRPMSRSRHTCKNEKKKNYELKWKLISWISIKDVGHCWRSRDELISDVLLWTPTYGQAKAGRPARTYIQQLCEDMGCSPEDLPEVMNNREKWRERVRDISATNTT